MLLMIFGFCSELIAQVTIGSGTSTQRYPLGAYYGYERSASLYTAAEIGIGGNITNLAWYPTVTSAYSRPIKIYLKTTSSSSLSAVTWATMISGATLVYNGSTGSIPSNTWFSFLLASSFMYNGADNLLVLVETNYGGSGGTTTSSPSCQYTTLTNCHEIWNSDSEPPTGNGTVGSSRPNIQITFSGVSVDNPQSFSATTYSSTGISFGWTKNLADDDVIIAYNASSSFGTPINGNSYSAGNSIAGGGTVIYTGSATLFNHTSLSASTQYFYKIWSVDSENNYSSGITANATTFCTTISSFPWTEGFESVSTPAYPSCWYEQNGDWVTTYNSSSSYDADARTGSQFLRESWSASNEYMWTLGFDLESGQTYDFSFWWAGDGYSGWTGDVFYNTSQSSSGATQMGSSFVTSGTTTSTTYSQVVRTITPAVTGVYFFAIRVNESTGDPWYLSFDDFSMSVSATCFPPTFISGTNITGSTADISWIAASPAPDNGYQYYLSGSSTEPSSGTVPTGLIAAGVVSLELSALSANTQYYLWLRSDCGSSDYSVWEGAYSFTTTNPPCDVSSISFSSSNPQPVLSGGIYYFDVCQGSDLFLSASVECSSCSTPDYSWIINAYDGNGPQNYSNDSFYFTINQSSGYDAQLKYEASGCVNTWPLRFRSSSGPNILNVSASIDGCAGNSAQILIGDGAADIEVEPFSGETSASLGSGEETFIPDGPSCVEQCYESQVTFTDFPIGSEISSADDLLYLRINFEHSFVGDIQISLVGPGNCGTAIILPDYFTTAQGGIDNYTYTWPYMAGFNYERIGFGEAVTLDIDSYADECDGELYQNVAGTGWDYCWSNNGNYAYANGSGYVYEAVNMSANSVLPYYRVNSSDPEAKTNFYHPYQNFSNLVGCPLNGTWTVSVCDSWAIDNGWIFDWEIALDPDLLPNSWTYQTSIDHVDFDLGTNASVNYFSGTNPLVYELVPAAGLVTGSYSGEFTVYDNFGCPTTADIDYSVQGLPTISGIDAGDYVWSGYANEFWNGSEENNWIVKTAAGYDVSSIAPPTGSNIYIVEFCNSSEMPELQQDISVNDISIISGGLSLSNHVLTVSGDFKNYDVFEAAAGTVIFSGSALQNVDAGGETFYNLTVSNTSVGISLLDNIIVENSLTMNSGNVSTGSYLLTLGMDAVNTGSLYHANGTINGSFKRWFNAATVSSVLFPVGTVDYYRPAYISFSSSPSTGGTLTARFVSSNPGVLPLALDDAGYLVEAVADEGYWTILNSGITDGIYNLDITASGFVTQDYTKLHLLKRADEFSDWMLEGSHLPSDGSSSIPVIRGHEIQTGSFEGTPTSGVARYYDVPGLAELNVTNISIDMYYWDSELNGLNEAALEGYQRVSYGADFWWTPLDGSINIGTNLFTTGGAPYEDWINTHPVTFNNRFTLGSKESPLPVELLVFESVCHSDGVELNWITASETNNDYFILEKSSDGANYSEIARIYGQGNSNSQSFYSYFDAADGKNNYYRLSQTDFDGLSESFPVIFADCFDGNSDSDFVILNNPVDEEILVQITGELNKEYSIYLINQLGQQILLQRNHLSNTLELVRISAAGLNPGIYSIVFMSENDVITRQIVKTK